MNVSRPLSGAGERQVRLTEQEAFANLRAVLELCAAGELKCSDKTSRPSAATIRTIHAHLAYSDFCADEPTAAWNHQMLRNGNISAATWCRWAAMR